MAKKIRYYDSTTAVRSLLKDYFDSHTNEVLGYLLDQTGFSSMQQLSEAEYNSYFGFDCGWVWLVTKNKEQEREWRLDNGKYDAYVSLIPFPYDCQSTTLKKIQLRKALDDLNLNDLYSIYTRLD